MIAFVPESPRGYSRERIERKRRRHARRRREFCELCRHPLPDEAIGRCATCLETYGAEGPFQENDPMAGCICVIDDETPWFLIARSVCGVPCPVHASTRAIA